MLFTLHTVSLQVQPQQAVQRSAAASLQNAKPALVGGGIFLAGTLLIALVRLLKKNTSPEAKRARSVNKNQVSQSSQCMLGPSCISNIHLGPACASICLGVYVLGLTLRVIQILTLCSCCMQFVVETLKQYLPDNRVGLDKGELHRRWPCICPNYLSLKACHWRSLTYACAPCMLLMVSCGILFALRIQQCRLRLPNYCPAGVVRTIRRTTGFTPEEIFRKYLWFLLRERAFDQGAVDDCVLLKGVLSIPDEQVLLVMHAFMPCIANLLQLATPANITPLHRGCADMLITTQSPPAVQPRCAGVQTSSCAQGRPAIAAYMPARLIS